MADIVITISTRFRAIAPPVQALKELFVVSRYVGVPYKYKVQFLLLPVMVNIIM